MMLYKEQKEWKNRVEKARNTAGYWYITRSIASVVKILLDGLSGLRTYTKPT